MLKKILLLALLPAIAFAEELPAPVKAIEKQGITIIKTFDAPGGMKGYLGKYQDMGQKARRQQRQFLPPKIPQKPGKNMKPLVASLS